MRYLYMLAANLLLAQILLVLAMPETARAQSRTVVAGYTEFSPYMFTDETGKATGFSVELLRDAATAEGFAIEFRRFDSIGALTDIEFFFSSSIAERLFALFNGSIDAVAGPPSVFRASAKEAGLAARLSSRTYLLA